MPKYMRIQSNSVRPSCKLVYILLVVVISGLLSSCAMLSGHTTPSYFDFKEDIESKNRYSSICPSFSNESIDPDNQGLNKKVCESRAYAYFKIDKYKGAYKELKTTNTFLFDLPMIGLAIATGATAIFSSNTNLIAGLALGTAGTTGLRQYFNNNGKAKYYLAAESEAQYVVNNSYIFTNAEYDSTRMNQNISILRNTASYTRLFLLKPGFSNANLKAELIGALKSSNTAIELGNKSISLINSSNEIIINSIDNIDLKLRGNINNENVDLNSIISLIKDSTKVEPPPTTDEAATNGDAQPELLIDEEDQLCQKRKNEPQYCNCQNLKQVRNNTNGMDADQFALYCILDLERKSNTISDKANSFIKFGEETEKCSQSS